MIYGQVWWNVVLNHKDLLVAAQKNSKSLLKVDGSDDTFVQIV